MGYLGSVVGVLKRVDGFKETYEKLSQVFTERSSLVQDKAKDNRMNPRERKTFVEWPELEAALKARRAKKGKPSERELRDNALLALYVDIPPRRAEDYQLMRVAFDPSVAKLKALQEPRAKDGEPPTNGNFNWLVFRGG